MADELRQTPPLQEQAERFRKLTRASRTLAQLGQLRHVIEYVATAAVDLVDAHDSLVVVTEGEKLVQVRYRRDGGIGPMEETQGPLDERIHAKLDVLDESYTTVPLIAQGEVIGVLGVRVDRPDGFGAEDEWLLNAFADQVSVALLNALRAERDRHALKTKIFDVVRDPEQRQMVMSAMAHDLRSPLLSMRIGCDLLENTLAEPTGEQREILRQMRAARQHLQLLAENLVEMGRISTGLVTITCKSFPLRRAIDDVIAIVAPEAQVQEQRIRVGNCEGVEAFADENRFRQIVLNLLSNAIKFAPTGSDIEVDCSVLDEDVHVRVTDYGPGIEPDQLEAVFLPYHHQVHAEANSASGVGLGLTIARELARKMGGDLTVASEPGNYTTFTVKLPLGDEPAGGA